MPFKVEYKDITTLKVDALVNSTNPEMVGYSGVDKIVHALGGEEFDRLCAEYKVIFATVSFV